MSSGYSALAVFVRILRYGARKWYLFAASVAFMSLAASAESYTPQLVRFAIDQGVSRGDLGAVALYALALLGFVALAGVAGFAARYFSVRFSQGVVHEVRVEAFAAVQRQSMRFFDRVATGQLISRITNDADRIAGFLSWQMRNLVNTSVMIAMASYYMLTMNLRLSAIALAAMGVMALANAKFALTIRPLYDQIRHQLGVLASIVTSSLGGIKTVKALALEDYMDRRFRGENDRFLSLSLRAAKVRAVYGNASFLVLGVAMSGILLYGGELIAAGLLTVGELTAFIAYLMMLMWPLRALGFIVGGAQRAIASARRIFDIIDSAPGTGDEPGAVELRDVRGEVRFENVTFSYVEGRPVLRNVSFVVRPGETVAIVGPPGSGKSTILKLLLRLYEPDEGRITIDGVDVRSIKLSSLRRFVALVPQEPFIFSGTVRENIELGSPGAPMERIVWAAKVAKIHDFIESLPRGYDTVVGERGVTLSGGQRQRIAIARALVADPRILLLDDPVSNLDAETEKRFVEDLREVVRGRTVIIVTQRLSLAQIADRILVLVDGRIVEEGRHDELIARRGHYYRLYISSLGGVHG